jgi:uncharacterized membrane protein
MENQTRQDLTERLDLIENMLAEGRRKTESWGWTFVLWGIAYYVAIAWSTWGQTISLWGSRDLAWPVTMIAAFILTMVIGIRRGKGRPNTTIGRAIISIWKCVGISMLLIFPALSIAGRLDVHAFGALVAAMLGIANGASGLILQWKAQFACAIVWWIAAVLSCFGSDTQLAIVFLSALFLCQIVFGIYAMTLEARRNRQVASHA